ncbi:DUF6732 family protein [Celeribacter sp.]|uniref:DUF6732 family protein n=1 Tax=Celeribacter sp. TaxID=1890673 RepID=UPI003A929019
MTRVLAFFFALIAAPSFAHPGHIVDAAGHDHWIAGIALGVAAGIAIWGAVTSIKGNKAKAEDASDAEGQADSETQEA